MIELHHCSHVHGRRESLNTSAKRNVAHCKHNVRVVRALAHVDMVVGVHWLFRAEFSAENFDGAVGDDLVSRLYDNYANESG